MERGTTTQVGIVSWVMRGCQGASYYTNVAHYTKWIETHGHVGALTPTVPPTPRVTSSDCRGRSMSRPLRSPPTHGQM